MNRALFSTAVAAIVFAWTVQTMAQDMGDPKRGATLAQTVCAECHTVDGTPKSSPNPMAPSFANVAKSSGMTALALRVWLQSPHPTMPNLTLNNEEKDDVIAYILSLKGR